jgi:hypothetical protein
MNIPQNWFDESDYFTGRPLTDDMAQDAEVVLGYKLPQSYLNLLRIKNGGTLRLRCYPTEAPTGWAKDHIEVDAVYGIAGKWGIDTEYGSRYLIAEWGYPEKGIVIGCTPSAGHEAIMLDYSFCGPEGEPRVVYVDTEGHDEEPFIVVLAANFEQFLQNLTSCDRFIENEQ